MVENCDIEKFRTDLLKTVEENRYKFEDEDGSWVVKGFIDMDRNIYTISADTKVVSKIIELILFPILEKFAEDNDYDLIPARCQNHYPDATFVNKTTKERIAVDIKTTYRQSETMVNGFTLGSYTGYFADRKGTKNITYPYGSYSHHMVLGVIYSHGDASSEMNCFNFEELNEIPPVISDFTFLVQEKYKLAGMKPGSGNTANIGSIKEIDKLINGEGPFAKLGVEAFDNYWLDLSKKRGAKVVL